MRHKILFISGWAHPGESLAPMAEFLEPRHDVELRAAEPGLVLTERTVLVGWSLGGMLALERAARQPDLVEALVMLASTPRFTFAAGAEFGTPEKDLLELMRQLKEDVKTTVTGFLAYAALPHRPRMRDMLQHFATLQEGLRYLLQTDLRADVERVKCPTLLIHGRQDAVIPHAASEWMAARIPGAKLVSVGNMGHDLPMRRAEWVAREIRTFLDEIPAA